MPNEYTTRDKFWLWRQKTKKTLSWGALKARLKKIIRYYISEQLWFFTAIIPSGIRFKFRRFNIPSVDRDCLLPLGTSPKIIKYAPNSLVVTERQYVLGDNVYYAYGENTVFKSEKWLFPAYTLYDLEAPEIFGFFVHLNNNYYHEIVDLFFQVYLLERYDYKIPVLWKGRPNRTQAALIDLFSRRGFDFVMTPSRLCCISTPKFWVFPQEYRIPLNARNSGSELFGYFRQYCQMLRKEIPPPAGPMEYPTRIYATRPLGATRVPPNNLQLEDFFRSHGYMVLDFGNFTLSEQIALAQNAEIIAGLHGANLTNIAFMRPGGACLEIMPDKKAEDNAYARLSFINDLKYTRIRQPGHIVDVHRLGSDMADAGLI